MKKWISGLLTMMLVVLIFTGCAGNNAQKEEVAENTQETTEAPSETAEAPSDTTEESDKVVIGRVQITLSDPFQVVGSEYLEKRCEELGAEVIVLGSDFDTEKEKTNVEDLISRGVDIIAVQPVSMSSGTEIAAMCEEAGIPVIFTIVPPDMEEYMHITIDEKGGQFEIGKQMAAMWTEQHPDTPVVAAIFTDPGVPWINEFRVDPWIQGVQSVVPDAEIIPIELGQFDAAYITSMFEDTITARPEINLIGGFASFTTIPALEVLKGIGRGTTETEIISGLQGDKNDYENIIADNSFVFTMGEKIKEFEETIADYAVKVVNGEYTSQGKDTIMTPSEVLTADSDWKTFLQEQWNESID